MKDLGKIHQCIGLIVEHDTVKGEMKIHQQPYTDKIVEQFTEEGDINVYTTPAETNSYQQVEEVARSQKEPERVTYPYREAIGSLLYLAVMTRPDISNIVRYLSRFVSNFSAIHVKLAKRVFGYLRGTSDIGIIYRSGDDTLRSYSDASYGDDYFTGRSTVAGVVTLNGGPIMWKSVLINFVVLSSTHSEYAAISETVNAVDYASHILKDIIGTKSSEIVILNHDKNAIKTYDDACKSKEAIDLHVDNMAAIYIATHDTSGKRSKHINVRFMNVKEKILTGLVKIKYISTHSQVADLLTKCLSRDVFQKFRSALLSR